jgi:DNA-binding transcriptional LysR family regulator
MSIHESHSLNWDDLKYFLAVARTGTLRGGADSIQVNHTTLTRRLSVMEERVGSRLFDRSKQGLVLTQLGEDLMPHAERVEAEMTAASRVIVGRDAQPSGTVYITLPHGLAMTSLMDDFTAFADLYPDIILYMNFSNDIRDLTRREADGSRRVASEETDDVVGRKLVQMSQAAYCTREYAERVADNGGEGLHLIGWHEPEEATTADWVKNSYYPKATLKHRVSELVPLITLASSGLGMAYLACNLGDRHPDLIRAPFQKPMPYRSIWLLLHRDLKNTARVRLFVDFLADQVRSRRNEFWVAGTATR